MNVVPDETRATTDEPAEGDLVALLAAPGDVVPLCVDLDGTLVQTDMLLEGLLALVKSHPLCLLLLPLWLVRGKAYFKQQVFLRAEVNVQWLPYNQPLVAALRAARLEGRPVVLATAANRRIAEQIAAHLGVFTEVLASDGRVNLSGSHKASAVLAKYGNTGYDYVGNAAVDVAIWRHARKAIVVNGGWGVERRARRVTEVAAVVETRPPVARALPRALRLHQWAKNALIFVPLLTAHRLTDLSLLGQATIAFLVFGLCASGVYVLNDLLDLEADRQHAKKKNRPFAAGHLPLKLGGVLIVLLLCASAGLSLLLPPIFRAVLGLYYILTLAYSFYFKRKLLLDVHFLGGLYTIRVLAGNAATGIAYSHWLLGFSMFMFLSLALVKRFSELQHLVQNNSPARGRSYRASDAQAIASLGSGSGFICVLILALYINSPQVGPLYQTPTALWLLCPLLMYWISRVWMIAYRGKMNQDPVVFALTDRVSYLVGAFALTVMAVAARDWGWFL